ncbi:MAG: LytTR family DNA-binding domain-containing protein [Xanthomonadales bacterium]|nr:LytTR family DNA-binding domain-containing protein [Xanthomonadales bacterium]
MHPTFKTLIVDDEAPARRSLKQRLATAKDVDIIAEARNGHEALQAIREQQPDLVFLDLQMPGLDGFDVLGSLSGKVPAIIFMTAFDPHAIEAVEANALLYLLKPIDNKNLQATLDHVRRQRNRKHGLQHRQSLFNLLTYLGKQPPRKSKAGKKRSAAPSLKTPAPKLVIRDGDQVNWVPQEEIDWIDAAGDYMCVHANGATYIMRQTMKRLEQALEPSILQRVHRSTIVNINKIRGTEPHINGEYFLALNSGQKLKLSRNYKHKLKYFGR